MIFYLYSTKESLCSIDTRLFCNGTKIILLSKTPSSSIISSNLFTGQCRSKQFTLVSTSDRVFYSVGAWRLISLSSPCLMWGQAVEDSWNECSGSVLDRWLPCLLHSPQLSSPHPQEETKPLMLLSLLAWPPFPGAWCCGSFLHVSTFPFLSLNT